MTVLDRYSTKRDGYVYFAQAESGGISPIKIGWSTNPWSQVREAHRWLWFQLEVIGYISVPKDSSYWGPGTNSLEKCLHKIFAKARVKREWFTASPLLKSLALESRNGVEVRAAIEFLAPSLNPKYVEWHMGRLG